MVSHTYEIKNLNYEKKMLGYEFLSRIHFRQCPKENYKFTRWLMREGLLRKWMKCPSCSHVMKLKRTYDKKEREFSAKSYILRQCF